MAELHWWPSVCFVCFSPYFWLVESLVNHFSPAAPEWEEVYPTISADLPWALVAWEPSLSTFSCSSYTIRAWRDCHQRTYRSYSDYCLEVAVRSAVSDLWLRPVLRFWNFYHHWCHHHCGLFPFYYFCLLYSCEPCLIFCRLDVESGAEILPQDTFPLPWTFSHCAISNGQATYRCLIAQIRPSPSASQSSYCRGFPPWLRGPSSWCVSVPEWWLISDGRVKTC